MEINVNASSSYNYKTFNGTRLVNYAIEDGLDAEGLLKIRKALELGNEIDLDSLNFLNHVVNNNVSGAEIDEKIVGLREGIKLVIKFVEGVDTKYLNDVKALTDSIKVNMDLIEDINADKETEVQ